MQTMCSSYSRYNDYQFLGLLRLQLQLLGGWVGWLEIGSCVTTDSHESMEW